MDESNKKPDEMLKTKSGAGENVIVKTIPVHLKYKSFKRKKWGKTNERQFQNQRTREEYIKK